LIGITRNTGRCFETTIHLVEAVLEFRQLRFGLLPSFAFFLNVANETAIPCIVLPTLVTRLGSGGCDGLVSWLRLLTVRGLLGAARCGARLNGRVRYALRSWIHDSGVACSLNRHGSLLVDPAETGHGTLLATVLS
jgi:hypothetical protein